MLIGHYAPALVLRGHRASPPLWTLFIGVQLVDYAWALFVLTGAERAALVPGFTQSNDLDLQFMPYSHGLLAACLWALPFAALVAWRFGAGRRLATGLLAAASVLSHWLLDLPMHVPDLPLVGDPGPKAGLGLWHYRELSFALEFVLVAGSLWFYLRRTEGPASAPWTRFFIALMLVLTVFGYYGPQPDSLVAMNFLQFVLYTGLALLAARVDRTRSGVIANQQPVSK